MKDPCELGVPETDELVTRLLSPALTLPFRQILDDIAKKEQALVDVPSFLEPGPSGTSLVGSFRTRQIHQVQNTLIHGVVFGSV